MLQVPREKVRSNSIAASFLLFPLPLNQRIYSLTDAPSTSSLCAVHKQEIALSFVRAVEYPHVEFRFGRVRRYAESVSVFRFTPLPKSIPRSRRPDVGLASVKDSNSSRVNHSCRRVAATQPPPARHLNFHGGHPSESVVGDDTSVAGRAPAVRSLRRSTPADACCKVC